MENLNPTDLRNKIGSLPVRMDDPSGDNVGIALASYFSDLPDCPTDDINDETGWSQWVMNKTDDVLDRIVDHFLSRLK